ncbi:MAG: hypothetical protein ACJ74O_01385 [Frankiaceae bacterium]
MGSVDRSRIAAMREVLATTGWVDRTARFGRSLRRAGHRPGGLLIVGTPAEEPWHLTAHLDEEARWSGISELAPTLVRWHPPPGAPAHLGVSLDRLEQAGRGETVFVVAPDAAPAELLERVSDAKHDGATVLALDAGDEELTGLAHEALTVHDELDRSPGGLVIPSAPGELLPVISFDLVSHLVSAAAGDPDPQPQRGPRHRLARMLDLLSGQPPDRG